MNNFITWAELPPAPPSTKPRKVPHNPSTGRQADPHDPSWWMTYEQADKAAKERGWKVGFVLSDNDPLFLFDLDDCRNPETGEVAHGVNEIFKMFPNVAAEVSINMTGFHIVGACDPSQLHEHKKKFELRGVQCEFYHNKRFVALGHGFNAPMGNLDCTAILKTILPARQAPTQAVAMIDQAVAEYTFRGDDDELIALMKNTTGSGDAVFDGDLKVGDFFNYDIAKLAKRYPSASGDEFDRSNADAGLMTHLAFFTGKNAARMDRIFRRSPLMRDKYKDRADYRQSTISGAITLQTKVYNKKQKTDAQTKTQAGGSGTGIMSLEEQQEHFKQCVYIASEHKVMLPDGELVKPATFKALYGGHQFIMSMDGTRPTLNAFEAFTENRVNRHPKAKRLRFKPQLPSGCFLDERGNKLDTLNCNMGADGVNAYFPQDIKTIYGGDASPILNHLAKILPVQRDREILLAWAARVVQSQGVKLPWSPIMQGTEGNGKSILAEIIFYCIGDRYSWEMDPEKIGKQFNIALRNRIFINVEEMNMFEKYSMMDVLKKLLTGNKLEIELKGVDASMYLDYCANWYFSTNHKDAIAVTNDTRRVAVFYTAQQSRDDMMRDGMLGEYFPRLWHWLRHENGFAIMRGYLMSYEIPAEFDPAGLAFLAPQTSSHNEAVKASLGVNEQYILEAVAENKQGFRGGWLSSYKVNELLKENNRKMAPRRLGIMLEKLGYVNTGKSTANIFHEDGTRPSLWRNDTSTQEYEIAQGYR